MYVHLSLWLTYFSTALQDDQYLRQYRLWCEETNVQTSIPTEPRESKCPYEDQDTPVLLHRLGGATQEEVEQKSTTSVTVGVEGETRQEYERRRLLRVSHGKEMWQKTKAALS